MDTYLKYHTTHKCTAQSLKLTNHKIISKEKIIVVKVLVITIN